jgi:hypothetical protein
VGGVPVLVQGVVAHSLVLVEAHNLVVPKPVALVVLADARMVVGHSFVPFDGHIDVAVIYPSRVPSPSPSPVLFLVLFPFPSVHAHAPSPYLFPAPFPAVWQFLSLPFLSPVAPSRHIHNLSCACHQTRVENKVAQAYSLVEEHCPIFSIYSHFVVVDEDQSRAVEVHYMPLVDCLVEAESRLDWAHEQALFSPQPRGVVHMLVVECQIFVPQGFHNVPYQVEIQQNLPGDLSPHMPSGVQESSVVETKHIRELTSVVNHEPNQISSSAPPRL